MMETRRTNLTLLKESDFDEILLMFNEPDTFKYIKGLRDKSTKEYLDYLNTKMNEIDTNTGTYWICRLKDTDEFIGCINLTPIPKDKNKIQIGWQIREKFHRKGIGSECAEKVLRYGLEEVNLKTIYGVFVKVNIASKRILEKLGFSLNEIKTEEDKTLEIYIYKV